jgi:hypothetical protein
VETIVTPIRVGIRLSLPSVNPQLTSTAILLFVDTRCAACDQDAQLYRDLAASFARHEAPRIFVVAPEDASVVRAWLSDRQIAINQTIQITDLASIGLSLTPTIALVDQHNIVEALFIGALSSAGRQDQFRSALTRSSLMRP